MDTPSPILQEREHGLVASAGLATNVLPPWDMYVVCVSLISGYILIPLLVSQMLLLWAPFCGDTVQMVVQQSTTLLTWITIFAVLRWRYGAIAQYLGLVLNRPLAYYGWEAVQLILLTTGLTLGLNVFWTVIAQLLPGWHPADKIPYTDYHSFRLLVLAGFAVLMAPFLEELIFRGLVQSTFYKKCQPLQAVFWATLVFLSLHGSYFGDIKALSHVLVLGLCLGFWRERTQSLVPGMLAHGFNNGLALFMLLKYAPK